jgi:hypothetical protein
MVQDALIMPP